MLGAGVPEATVNEDGDATLRKRYIGPDELSLNANRVILAEPVAQPVQGRAQLDLGLCSRLRIAAMLRERPGVVLYAPRPELSARRRRPSHPCRYRNFTEV